MTNETNLLKRKIPVNNYNGEVSNHSAEEKNEEEEVMFIKQVKLEPQNHRHPVKLQSERVLRPYQEQCIKDMRKLELSNTEQERNIYGGSYAVQRKAHCGMLASKVGSGKTMMVIKFIEYFGTTPHRRTTIASSFMHTDSIHMTYYRVNLVVVPNALTKQWGDEIAQCGMSKKFLWFDSASKLNEFYNEIQYVRHDEDEDEEEERGDFFLNVLVSSSFYDALGHCRVLPDGAGLVNKTTAENRHLPKFNSHNMFMRIFFDEADARNPVIIYADFIWLISATLLFTIQQSQTKFGSSKRRDTMFGALKLANRFFNIEQLCIKTPDEVVDTQCNLMQVDSFKLTMRKSFMDSFWAQIESNCDDNLAMHESFGNINTWYTQIAKRLDKLDLLNSLKHVTRYSDFCLRVNRLNHMTTDVLREIETIFGGKEAKRIREEGLFVMGIGKKITPIAFVNSCEIFTFSENIDLKNKTEKIAWTSSLPDNAFIIIAISHGIGSFAAGLIAGLVAGRSRMSTGMISMSIIFMAVMIYLFTYNFPVWFVITDTVATAILGFAGAVIGSSRVYE